MVLFTAGLEDYAKPICDELDARYGGAFHARLYRPATTACAAYPCLKVLPPHLCSCVVFVAWHIKVQPPGMCCPLPPRCPPCIAGNAVGSLFLLAYPLVQGYYYGWRPLLHTQPRLPLALV